MEARERSDGESAQSWYPLGGDADDDNVFPGDDAWEGMFSEGGREDGQSRKCLGCGRPHVVCLCSKMPQPVSISGLVVILQHPMEVKRRLATIPLLSRCLDDCVVLVGREFGPYKHPQLYNILDTAAGFAPVFMLFPGPGAADLVEVTSSVDYRERIEGWRHRNVAGEADSSAGQQEGGAEALVAKRVTDEWAKASALPAKEEGWLVPGEAEGGEALRRGGEGGAVSLAGGQSEGQMESEADSGAERQSWEAEGAGDTSSCHTPLTTGERCPWAYVLIALDGTWEQAKDIFRNVSPRLLAPDGPCLRVELRDGQGNESAEERAACLIRREPLNNCVTTMEAISRALSLLEQDGGALQRTLLAPLRQLTLLQAEFDPAVKARMKGNSGDAGPKFSRRRFGFLRPPTSTPVPPEPWLAGRERQGPATAIIL